jgi:hypothetical protein
LIGGLFCATKSFVLICIKGKWRRNEETAASAIGRRHRNLEQA